MDNIPKLASGWIRTVENLLYHREDRSFYHECSGPPDGSGVMNVVPMIAPGTKKCQCGYEFSEIAQMLVKLNG